MNDLKREEFFKEVHDRACSTISRISNDLEWLECLAINVPQQVRNVVRLVV